MALSSAMLMALAAVAVTDGPHTDLELLVAQCAALLAAVDHRQLKLLRKQGEVQLRSGGRLTLNLCLESVGAPGV